MTRLAIIIVSYNSRKDLETALHSLTEPAATTPHEIVVVDNASTDSTAAYIRERWPRVRLIASESNLGFAQANNVGIHNTSSELVLLVNPDTIVTGAAVDRLVSVLESQPDVAIVGPRIVDGNGRAELSFGAMISPWAELRQKILVRGNDRGLSLITAIVDRMTRRTHRVDWVSGACLADPASGSGPGGRVRSEVLHVCRGRRPVCGSSLTRPFGSLLRRAAGGAPARAVCRGGTRPSQKGLSQEPDRLLRQAPPRVGAVSEGLPQDHRTTARYTQLGGHPLSSDVELHVLWPARAATRRRVPVRVQAGKPAPDGRLRAQTGRVITENKRTSAARRRTRDWRRPRPHADAAQHASS